MADKHTATIEVHSEHASEHHEPGALDPNVSMAILTWVTFFTLLAVLHKFAWKPILAALDTREKDLRDAIENADKVKAELESLDQKRNDILFQAEAKSKELIVQSRKAAVEAAKTIEHKAKEEAKIILENARREIHEQVQKAQADLREESSRIAVALAGKIIEENLDTEKNRKLVNQLIKDI